MKLRFLLIFGFVTLKKCNSIGEDSSCSAVKISENTVELYFNNVNDLKDALENNAQVQELLSKYVSDSSCNSSSTITIGTSVETTASTREVVLGTTSKGIGENTKPTTSTAETRGGTSGTTNGDDSTTAKQISSAETTTHSRESTSKDWVSTPTATCPPLVSNETCEVIYDGKCFTWITGATTFDLEEANKTCLGMEFQLGNIYDDCHYELIMDKLGSTLIRIWTGMTIEFSSGSEDYTVHLRSGEDASIGNWWYKGYPELEANKHYLTIEVKILQGIWNEKGIQNSEDVKTDGAFCEKQP